MSTIEIDPRAPYEIVTDDDGDVMLADAPGTTYTHLESARRALSVWRDRDPDGEYWIIDHEGEPIN